MTNPLARARALLDEGNVDQARKVILHGRRQPSGDPEALFQWGLLCERIEAFPQARQSYEDALRLSPRNPNYLYRFGALLYEAGSYEKAARYLAQAVNHDPGHSGAKTLLAELLDAIGYKGAAKKILPCHKEEKPPLRYFAQPVGSEDIDLFMRLFSGRETGYALQELREHTGKAGWSYHEGVVTPELVEMHIKGEISLAGLPLRTDNTVRYAAIHVRPQQRILYERMKSPGMLIQTEEAAHEEACRIINACSSLDVPLYIEDSGDHGRRVWLFFDQFSHFLLIRRAVKQIIELAAPYNSLISVEPLLATEPVGIGWQERPILLPLGVNRQTERRCLFIDPRGAIFPEQIKQLRKIRPIDAPGIQRIIKGRSASIIPPYGAKGKVDPLKRLWDGCPVLAEIKEKTCSGRTLKGEERTILLYAIGVSHRYRKRIHELLEPSPDYNYSKVERMLNGVKPHAISCLKIRQLVPEITSSVHCACIFDLRGGRYPSPFLHLDPGTPLCVSEDPLAGGAIRDLVDRYVLLVEKEREIKGDIMKVTKAIKHEMSRRGIDHIRTSWGVVRLCPQDEGQLIVEGK